MTPGRMADLGLSGVVGRSGVDSSRIKIQPISRSVLFVNAGEELLEDRAGNRIEAVFHENQVIFPSWGEIFPANKWCFSENLVLLLRDITGI